MTTFSNHLDRWRTHRAAWMDQPGEWAWPTPNGWHGPALHWRAGQVGLANLLWLALDLAAPPVAYVARDNPLYTRIIVYAGKLLVNDTPLIDHAECLTLEQFRDLCGTGKWAGPGNNILPLLHLLANRRLHHAHT